MIITTQKKSISIKKGFTLIEVLVVIAIIATFAGISYSVGRTMFDRSKEKESQLRMQELITAINDFEKDHNSLPYTGSSYPNSETQIAGSNLKDLLEVLLDQESATDKQNKKSKKYLSMPTAKSDKNGIIYNTSGDAENILDGWGEDFHIIIDYDLDSKIEQSFSTDTNTTVNGHRVIMISGGADRQANGKDDVYSWKK